MDAVTELKALTTQMYKYVSWNLAELVLSVSIKWLLNAILVL